jgi:hypothetical protein
MNYGIGAAVGDAFRQQAAGQKSAQPEKRLSMLPMAVDGHYSVNLIYTLR